MNFSRIAASLCLVALTACSSSPAPKACQSGQVSQYNGTAWECVALQQLLPSTCEVGQVITFTGSGIACTTPGTAVGPTGTTGAAGATGATGPTGSQGTTGLQGVPALNWQGTWEASTSYMTGDAVAFGGSSYIATSSNTADQPPSSSWDLLASEGTTGATGPNGLTGTAGMTGGIGLTGATGPVGANGAESLVVQTPEPPAGSCSAGGVQVQSGVDTNGDGVLEPDEVTSTTELCNGATGTTGANGLNSLVSTSAIPSGSTCSNGGTLVQSGLDLNGDGSLEANEVTSTAPVCNGIPGAVSLLAMSPIASGATCASGGTLVDSGVDANGDGILEPSEVTSTSNICNGAPGATGPIGPAGTAGVVGAVGATGPQGIPGSGSLANLGVAAIVQAGGSLLVSLTQSDGVSTPTATSPVVIGFRNATPTPGTVQMIDVAGPLSITVPEGATLGALNNVAAHAYVYAQEDSGAAQLCISANGNIDEGSVQASVAIGSSATSTAGLYCSAASTGPVRLIGRLLLTEATAGTWLTNPAEVAIPPFLAPPAAFFPATEQIFTSGTGTYYPSYVFTVASASATAGATYTNNGQTFIVSTTISSQTALIATGSGLPTSSGTLTLATGVGNATITFSAYDNTPHYLEATLLGGGAGGTGGQCGAEGSPGSATTFGTSYLVANGAPASGGESSQSPGAGAAPLPAGAMGVSMPGSQGAAGTVPEYGNNTNGASGGSSPLGGAGVGGNGNGNNSYAPGTAAAANSGSGGGGGACPTGNCWTGAGGGAGNFVKAIINSPAASYAYSVGGGGAGGSCSSYPGGTGGSGIIIVEEHY